MTRARRATLICAGLLAAPVSLAIGCDAILGIERAEQDPSSTHGSASVASSGSGGADAGTGGADAGTTSSAGGADGGTTSSSTGGCASGCNSPGLCQMDGGFCSGVMCVYAPAQAGMPCLGGTCDGDGGCFPTVGLPCLSAAECADGGGCCCVPVGSQSGTCTALCSVPSICHL